MGSVIEGAEYFRFPEVFQYAGRGRTESEQAATLTRLAEPGDLLFVRTPGRLFSAGRALTRNPYDHVAVVLEGHRTLNIVTPRTVTLPVSYFTKPVHKALLMRPQWESEGQRALFLEEIGQYGDCRYNLRKTILGIVVTCLYSWLGVRIPLRGQDGSGTWICTEAILASLRAALPGFRDTERLRLDYRTLGFATTSDFFRIAREMPGLLRIVK